MTHASNVPWVTGKKSFNAMVMQAKRQARSGEVYSLLVEAGEEGSGRVFAIWYAMGFRRPQQPPDGFTGLCGFAVKRTGALNRPAMQGVFLYPIAMLAAARRQLAALLADNYTLHGSVYMGMGEDYCEAS